MHVNLREQELKIFPLDKQSSIQTAESSGSSRAMRCCMLAGIILSIAALIIGCEVIHSATQKLSTLAPKYLTDWDWLLNRVNPLYSEALTNYYNGMVAGGIVMATFGTMSLACLAIVGVLSKKNCEDEK